MNIIFIIIVVVLAITLGQLILVGGLFVLSTSDWFVERLVKFSHNLEKYCEIEIDYEANDE